MITIEKSSTKTIADKLKKICLLDFYKDVVNIGALLFCLLQIKLGFTRIIKKIEITKNSVDKSFGGSSQQNHVVL